MKQEFDFRVLCAWMLEKHPRDMYGNDRYETHTTNYMYLDLPKSVVKPRKVRLFKEEKGYKDWSNRPQAQQMVDDQFLSMLKALNYTLNKFTSKSLLTVLKCDKCEINPENEKYWENNKKLCGEHDKTDYKRIFEGSKNPFVLNQKIYKVLKDLNF